MKTVSIGIRFLPEDLDAIKKREGLDTAQQVVGFLIGRYMDEVKEEQAAADATKQPKKGSKTTQEEKLPFEDPLPAIMDGWAGPKHYDKEIPVTLDRNGLERMRKEVQENPRLSETEQKGFLTRIDFKLNRLGGRAK